MRRFGQLRGVRMGYREVCRMDWDYSILCLDNE